MYISKMYLIKKLFRMMNIPDIKNIPRRAVIKYSLVTVLDNLLIIIILILARNWITIPPWLFWTVIAISFAKDIIVFPYVWTAFDPKAPGKTRTIIGQRGTAVEPLSPGGYIRLQGELWKAETVSGCPAIAEGQTVKVESAHGLKVFVVPDNAAL